MKEKIEEIVEYFRNKKDFDSCIFTLHIYMKSLDLEDYKIIDECVAMGSYGMYNCICISWIDNERNLDCYITGFYTY